MSGYKRATVTISEEEYRRLHDADMQRRFMKKRPKAKTDRGSRQLEGLKSAYGQVEARQNHYEQLLANLNEDVRSIEWHASQELVTSQAAFYENVIAEMDRSAGEMESSLTQMLVDFQEQWDCERIEYQQGIEECLNRIQALSNTDANKLAFANAWLEQSTALYDFIAREYDTNHFVPGRLEQIKQRLDLARMNLDRGLAESAVSTLQAAYLDLSNLRVQLEAMTLEWQNLFACAYSALRELTATVVTNAQIPALDIDGNELPIVIDVDLWSGQRHQALLKECRSLKGRLTDQLQEIQIEELRFIVGNDIPRLRHALETIIFDARLSVIQAQLRANIAELALQALANHGFTLVEAGYVGNDADAPFDAQLRNRADGISVRVRVMPQSGQKYVNDVIVTSEDAALRTEHEMRARFVEIRSAFAEYGLTVGPTQTIPNIRTLEDHSSAVKRRNPESETVQDVRAN